MNTGLINSAAGVINAALTQNRTAAGIALALDSAQLLLTPETTAELAALQARVAESKASPLAWARLLDAKSLDNFLTVLGSATEYEPMDGALSQVEEILRSFRACLLVGAEEQREQTLHDHVITRDAEIEKLRKRVAELEKRDATARTELSNAHDDLAGALGYSTGTEWADLISIASANAASVARAETGGAS